MKKLTFVLDRIKSQTTYKNFGKAIFLQSKILQEKKIHSGKMPNWCDGMSDILINAAINFIAMLFKDKFSPKI